ncbi:hypothetical protein BD408DRAFT_384881 [Parasitella parasitica]|nr:hypothetical protein BD408DRAFT_384881 [Parasitella parasitica]
MESNVYNGVRAEPKFLRDPTSFESISSGISRISSYVTSNLPKRKSTSMTSPFDPQYQQYQAQQQKQQQQQQQQQAALADDVIEDMDDVDAISFAAFEKLEYREKTISCLLLGYHDGFQLWDISNPDNVHELVSIRDKDAFGVVSFIHILQGQQEPVLAIISETTTSATSANLQNVSSNEPAQTHNRMNSTSSTSTASTTTSSRLIIYSLQSQSTIKEISDFGDEENDDIAIVTCIKSNHKVIALGCSSRHRSFIRILSAADYTPFASPLTDIYHDPSQGPIFTLGSRFIAYATNTAVLNSDPVMSSLTSYNVLQGDKDVKGAAKDIAKEVVSGMKTLGEFGFNTLQNYFGNQLQPHPQGPPQQEMYDPSSPSSRKTNIQNGSPNDNIYLNTSNSLNSAKKMVPSGMIMIRDILKLPKTPTRNLSLSTIAHFRPHSHPVSCLTFNQAGTLLMSASKQGHTFHIFGILANTVHGNASHLYSLSRGITDAQVVDCQFSVDSTWCAITTARGTTHVYAINPYGGKPEISGHVHGKVNNPVYHPLMASSNSKAKPKATVLNSVIRIKQRRKMPGNSLNSSQDDLGKFIGQQQQQQQQNGSGYSHGYYGPTPPQYVSSMMPPPSAFVSRNTAKEPKAKIIAMFVTASKSPYLVNNSVYKSSLSSHTSLSSNSDSPNANPLGSIKQQATSMLSSFGSSMSHIPYMPTSSSQQSKKWDKNSGSDTLMFGFDEEYDDSTKMINDEIGYQDMYSFHPDGVLTLHRCWVAKTVVKKRENGRMLEKLDLSLKEEDVAEWRVARNVEWDEVRLSVDSASSCSPPEETSPEPHANNQKKKKNKQSSNSQKNAFAVDTRKKKLWLSNAEITTYTNDEPALWTRHQFIFQKYQETKDLQRLLHAGIIPNTDTMIMLKGMPEPVSSRIDRVKNTTTRIANDSAEENMEDALAELEDNISKAMQTSFSPSSNSMGNSPATNLKWLSSSANAAMNGSPSPSATNKSFLDRNSSLSFEDAYLINMGSGPSPEPSMHGHTPKQQQQPQALHDSSLIRFDDDDDDDDDNDNDNDDDSSSGVKQGIDVIRLGDNDDDNHGDDDAERPRSSQLNQKQQEGYSPDGDNEVEYPYESVYENIHRHPSKDDSDDDDDQVPW